MLLYRSHNSTVFLSLTYSNYMGQSSLPIFPIKIVFLTLVENIVLFTILVHCSLWFGSWGSFLIRGGVELNYTFWVTCIIFHSEFFIVLQWEIFFRTFILLSCQMYKLHSNSCSFFICSSHTLQLPITPKSLVNFTLFAEGKINHIKAIKITSQISVA